MGWTYFEKGPESTTEWFRKTLEWANEQRSSKVLASAIVGMKEAYAAVETIYSNGQREVWAAVFLINFVPRATDGLTFGYKDMEESMGPTVARCPAKILDLLTPTDNESASDWRRRCRERLEKLKNNKLSPGDLIRLEHPLNFVGYGSYDTFRMEIVNGRVLFTAMSTETGNPRFLCRITNWKDRDFTRIAPEDVKKVHLAEDEPQTPGMMG